MTRPHRTTGALVSVAAIVALAACGSSKSSTQSSTATTAAGGAATTAAPAACPDFPAGTPIKIGFFGALTGPNSPQLGVNASNGVQLAINEYNKTATSKVQFVA